MRLARAAKIVEAIIDETLTYFAMPAEHLRWFRTNNPLERLMRDVPPSIGCLKALRRSHILRALLFPASDDWLANRKTLDAEWGPYMYARTMIDLISAIGFRFPSVQ